MAECSGCRFSAPAITDDLHEPVLLCRRFPPQLLVYSPGDDELDMGGQWPQVGEMDWCGEFEFGDDR